MLVRINESDSAIVIMRSLRVTVAAVLLVALSGSWILRGAAQTAAPKNAGPTSTAPKSKGPVRKPAVAAPRPDAKTPTTNPPLFVDVTHAAGVDFRLTCGGQEKLYILETQCGGAAAFDYDNDGWMDILLVDGSTLADYRAGKCHPPRLYHNNHDGTFTDVSAMSGLNFCGWGYGVAVGDYDNDGWEDIYITGFNRSALYHNNHDRNLIDRTAPRKPAPPSH